LFKDNVLHYGQKFTLQINPRLSGKDIRLYSSHITPLSCARISRMQEVQCKADTSYGTVWEIEHIDPKVRFEFYGKPVKSNEEILVKHSFTNVWLASNPDFPMA